ncbi:hypothetical protein OZX73_04560 [Bifidobacterium sp. ESL0775]|uniref:hypothetical protein n=1 Tax=Bifidobacterium sp. ESL0775 TaxID=2983230 RepID=UPI0023F802F4|nr:hypothetical protein [Bifidobacterium sp. ESL0775]WEV68577.1 hypothetical protein OZX73_04560 [Bifidobacterium sp. ESL0775]
MSENEKEYAIHCDLMKTGEVLDEVPETLLILKSHGYGVAYKPNGNDTGHDWKVVFNWPDDPYAAQRTPAQEAAFYVPTENIVFQAKAYVNPTGQTVSIEIERPDGVAEKTLLKVVIAAILVSRLTNGLSDIVDEDDSYSLRQTLDDAERDRSMLVINGAKKQTLFHSVADLEALDASLDALQRRVERLDSENRLTQERISGLVAILVMALSATSVGQLVLNLMQSNPKRPWYVIPLVIIIAVSCVLCIAFYASWPRLKHWMKQQKAEQKLNGATFAVVNGEINLDSSIREGKLVYTHRKK